MSKSEIDSLVSRAAMHASEQLEAYLRSQVAALGITAEEFMRDYEIEEWPLQTSIAEDFLGGMTTVRLRHEYKIKRKESIKID
jgi:hypothetical protein